MAAISGVLNHNTSAAQALAGTSATPMAAASATSSSNSASSSSATISANDFLTLLVTEMKNQDPTATTDPNEYINQLVNVNSLQQLIAINQTLTTDLAPASGASGTTPTPGVTGATSILSGSGAKTQSAANESALTAAQPASSNSVTTVPDAISAAAAKLAPGNLGIPTVNQSAQAVAQSLSGRPRVQ
ncbi:MAG: flagellar hook capping FlgD N-terminal domain-containing protein [Terracidiphilus sp.]